MDLRCTAVFRRVPEGCIAFTEEFPGANTRARSLDESPEESPRAVASMVEANRMIAREDDPGVRLSGSRSASRLKRRKLAAVLGLATRALAARTLHDDLDVSSSLRLASISRSYAARIAFSRRFDFTSYSRKPPMLSSLMLI